MSVGRQIETSQWSQIRTFPGRSDRIFGERSEDAGGKRPRDVLGANICRHVKGVLDTKIKEVENKIPLVIGLVKKTDYDTKVLDIENKCFNTSDYIKFTKYILDGNRKKRVN